MTEACKVDKYYKERGQTLNEAVIAVSLLTFGVIGMLGGIVRSFSQTGIVADRMTATFLAAEGVEIAKNIVDGRSMRNSKSGIDPSGGEWSKDFIQGEYYELDPYDATKNRKANISPSNINLSDGLQASEKSQLTSLKSLMIDPATSVFSYSGSEDTVFRRVVGASVRSGNHMKMKSYVYWRAKNGVWHEATAETDLLNWR